MEQCIYRYTFKSGKIVKTKFDVEGISHYEHQSDIIHLSRTVGNKKYTFDIDNVWVGNIMNDRLYLWSIDPYGCDHHAELRFEMRIRNKIDELQKQLKRLKVVERREEIKE